MLPPEHQRLMHSLAVLLLPRPIQIALTIADFPLPLWPINTLKPGRGLRRVIQEHRERSEEGDIGARERSEEGDTGAHGEV